MALESTGAGGHGRPQAVHVTQPPAGLCEHEILHQRDFWKTADPFEDLAPHGECLVSVGKPYAARPEVEETQPGTT
jgi:hypothetical protein